MKYLNILYLAARGSETAVDDALRVLIDNSLDITDEQVEALVKAEQNVPAVTDVHIAAVDLRCYDALLQEVTPC